MTTINTKLLQNRSVQSTPAEPLEGAATVAEEVSPRNIFQIIVDKHLDYALSEPYAADLRPTHRAIERAINDINCGRRDSDRVPMPSLQFLSERANEILGCHASAGYLGRPLFVEGRATVKAPPKHLRPLEVVGLTSMSLPLDIAVDSKSGARKRLDIAVAICGATKYAVGVHISTASSPASALKACVENAISPKSYVKAKWRDIQCEWKAMGRWDNAVVSVRKSEEQRIRKHLGKFGTKVICAPYLSGDAERLCRSLTTDLLHSLGIHPYPLFPGTLMLPSKPRTFSLDEVNELVHAYIIDVYNQRVHASLGITPADAWDRQAAVHKNGTTVRRVQNSVQLNA
jgi:putative transposase